MEISMFQFVMFGLTCFMLGTSLMLAFADWYIITPMNKTLKSSLKGWGDTLDLLAKAVEAMPKVEVPKVEPDGSMKSPIQIKKEE